MNIIKKILIGDELNLLKLEKSMLEQKYEGLVFSYHNCIKRCKEQDERIDEYKKSTNEMINKDLKLRAQIDDLMMKSGSMHDKVAFLVSENEMLKKKVEELKDINESLAEESLKNFANKKKPKKDNG